MPVRIFPPTRRTTVDIGTAFELHALRYLNEKLFMDLRRVGGAGDGGVDLRGWWWVPKARGTSSSFSSSRSEGGASGELERKRKRVRVVVQCKAEKKSLGPRNVRELEGVMSQLQLQSHMQSNQTSPPSSQTLPEHDQAISLLVSQSGFSKGAMIHATKSKTPLMLVHLPGGQPFGSLTPERLTPSSSPSPVARTSSLSLETPFRTSSDLSGEESFIDTPPTGSRDDQLESDKRGEVDDIQVESIWWNKALSEGVLGGLVELRREVLSSGRARVGLWTSGKRLGRYSPAE
ncbi:hypothetical protein CI109_104717 [Kwoniella shandongensis]|uniref:Uncharacterized protein n=1 Tax=Kwoniella shandongensis TaxID=1734106 RepID=A0A5M6BPM9_9TREE|nr:uncharacterized protein CI109_006971 [Kwoniella shandongensis]KAA5524713.1 hypothetical protein CI109_006971 [Kwoniella shandongensis]